LIPSFHDALFLRLFAIFAARKTLAKALREKCAQSALEESEILRFPPAEAGGKEETAEAV
jgi:hypothetical protein